MGYVREQVDRLVVDGIRTWFSCRVNVGIMFNDVGNGRFENGGKV